MIKVTNYTEAINQLRLCPDEIAVICITNSNIGVPLSIQECAAEVFEIKIDDESDFENQTFAAIKFASKQEDLIICCHSGVELSPSFAYIIECTRVGHPALACGILDKNIHQPNEKIIKEGEMWLDDVRVMQEYNKWLNKK